VRSSSRRKRSATSKRCTTTSPADSGPARAIGYIARIEAFCRRFDLAGQRGHSRDDIRAGLRIVGFERRVTIAFHVDAKAVVIDRIFYGGRNVAQAFKRDDV
jgi:toxin ParE1/3/4